MGTKTTKTTNKVTTNKAGAKKGYVSTNEVFNSITMRNLARVGLWDEKEIDELFKVAHHKPQLNSLNKELKITLTTFYLALPYETKIKRVYNERIRRFKWENSTKWDKDVKAFTDDKLQASYSSLKNDKQQLLSKVAECKTNTLNRIKSALLFQTYEYYRMLQSHKNCDDYDLYKNLYKVAIAQYLQSNGVTPSIKLIDYLCDDTNISGINKNINADNVNVKSVTSYEKYVINFTYSLVQSLIDYKVINCESYLHNSLFANSLDNIDTQSDLQLLQDIAQIDE